MGFTTILDHAYHLDRPAKSVKPHQFIDIRSIFRILLIFTIGLPIQPLMSHTKHRIRAKGSPKAIEPVLQVSTKATFLLRAHAFVGREPSWRDMCAPQVPLTTQGSLFATKLVPDGLICNLFSTLSKQMACTQSIHT